MKMVLMVALAVIVGLSLPVNAALVNLGTDSVGNRLIYDSDLDITWYDYSRYTVVSGNYVGAYWDNQMAWADGLTVTFGDITYSDWRLPRCSEGVGPSATCTNNEFYHLYHTELGNVVYPGSGYGLHNTGDFQHLVSAYYWTGTTYINDIYAVGCYLGTGGCNTYTKGSYSLLGIAVRNGLAVAPEPISSVLFVAGGTLLAGRRLLKRGRS